MKNKNGFVISAILYPLLVLFLALIMGLLAMSDTRKRILDKMKLEIADSIFDDAECSCDTILNKLNYIIKNGVGGGGNGSYQYNVLGLNVKGYETPEDMPNIGNAIGDIAVITDVEVANYYVSQSAPGSPKEGDVWIVQDITSPYHITSDYSNIGISYAMQYIENKWILKKAYVFDEAKWKLLYYVSVQNGVVDLMDTDINAEIIKEYGYTGKYQTFRAMFSGYYQVELWGAQGGSYSTGVGGKGAYTKGEIYLKAGEILYIYVGSTTSSGTGGWNGGGNAPSTPYWSGGGGGATDVRLVPTIEETKWNEFESLKSRIMVAAGGGGSGYCSANGNSPTGGAGGELLGYQGAGGGTGGTQSAGGTLSQIYYVGNFGYGGNTSSTNHTHGAGGGGWYGGGGTETHYTGGGGGSSYISGHERCSSIAEESTSSNIVHNGSAYHYSGYYFINTTMSAGENTGNGKAKITLKTIEIISDDDIENIKISNSKENAYMFSSIDALTGKYQLFDSLKSGNYQIELWGAQGGSYSTGVGGKGAYTKGVIHLNAGQRLYVYVGGTTVNAKGGWNGGGEAPSTPYWSGGGGGSTDVRLVAASSSTTWNESLSLRSRIMVAAGGGGSGYCSANGNAPAGGAGGGLSGYQGASGGTGGTQINGGSLGAAYIGEFGYGANTSSANHTHGAGGSGWYGGGGTNTHYTGGGGGSSYISGHAGCIGVDSSGKSITSAYTKIEDSYSYTGYKFTLTQMIDGNGYIWTTTKAASTSTMPSFFNTSNITGNTGNGYARITYLGN